MATLQVRLQDLATRVASECKSLRTLMNANSSDLSSLTTTNKTNLVSAINELKTVIDGLASSGGATINDEATASAVQTWSINKISSEITAALNAVLAGAPTALDTLSELAAAINNDGNFASTITTALGNRVRTDIDSQGLTLEQRANARTNIDAYGSVELGNPDTNLVTTFNAGLI